MIWYSKYLQVYEKPFAEAPASAIEEVRQNIAKLQSDEPLVTVSIIGYNEEKHLLACLWSLYLIIQKPNIVADSPAFAD